MAQGAFLAEGDLVEIEMDHIGVLRNPSGPVARGDGVSLGDLPT